MSQAKNHATSSFTQKINAFRLLALCFFLAAHCQKLSLVLRSNNAAIYAYTDNTENYYQALCRYVFHPCTVKKSVIYSYLSYKNAATLVTAFNQGKTYTFRPPPVRVFSCTLLKSFLQSKQMSKNTAL